MSSLALSEQIRATLMPGFEGTEAPDWVIDALQDGLRAVCVYGANVRDRAQVAELGRRLRAVGPEALIAIDEEGGEVTRLHYAEGSPYPGAAVLGRIDDASYTEQIGARVGRDVRTAGFDLVLGPVADVNSNAANPVIGTRSFGADPELVSRHVSAWIRGLEREGAIACPKHFPGHGDTAQDSHLALPVVDAAADLIASRDLPPFEAAIAAGAGAIMTSHILIRRLDPDAPATFSRAILQRLLREKLGFTGVIVSDALDMRGASEGIGIPEAAVRALQGGCDLLCLGIGGGPEQLRQVEEHIAQAVSDGRLSKARVRYAACRARTLTVRRSGATADTEPVVQPASDAELERIIASFSGSDAARIWLGEHPGARILELESEANQAVGGAPWGPFAPAAADLAGLGPDAPLRAELSSVDGTDSETAGNGASGMDGAIVIGRGLADSHDERLAALRAAETETLEIELGWPTNRASAASASTTRLDTFGSSALVGAALLRLIEEGRR